jgi:murein DD-endopeptidase MepM/ murein hydrolase activator NlpD
MPRLLTRASFVASLLVSTACSQTPAPIDLKGQNNYSRAGTIENTYAANSYSNYNALAPAAAKPYQPAPVATNYKSSVAVSQSTQQMATVDSIGVSDLPAPSKLYPAKQQPIAAAEPEQHVNPWTGRPHFSDSDSKVEAAKTAPRSQDKPIAQLDSIISSDSPKTTKPVVLQHAQTTDGLMWPVNSHKVLSSFGPKGGGKVNDGINIASKEGEPVWAAADGEVVYVGNELQGYGNMVLIKHVGGKTTTYAHLNSSSVDKYDRVKQGDIIGYVGSTGNVKAPQLHFAIRDGKEAIDPQKYLSRSVASN